MTQIVAFQNDLVGKTPTQVSPTNPLPVVASIPAPSPTNKATFVRGLSAPIDITIPVRVAPVGTYVQSVVIYAQRAGRVANAQSVFIDSVAANDGQLIELIPGSFISFTAPPGKTIDLGDIYVDAQTLTDGVFFLGVL